MNRLLKDRRWPPVTVCAAWLVGCCLIVSLLRFYRNNLCGMVYSMALAPLAYGCGALLLYHTGVLKNAGLRLLTGFFIWFFISIALNEKYFGSFLNNRVYMDTLFMYLFVCFPLGLALKAEDRRRLLNRLIAVSVAVLSVMSLLGVIAVLRGEYWITRFPTEFGIGVYPGMDNPGAYRRLTVLCYPNSVGMMCAIGLLLSAYRVLTGRGRLSRILYALAMLPLYGALAFSVSRTATLAAGLGLGLMALRWCLLHLPVKRTLIRALLALAAAAVVLLALYAGSTLLLDSAAPAQADVPAEAASAQMEGETGVTAAERPISGDIAKLTGRTDMWRAVFLTIRDTPRLLLIGSSPTAVGTAVEVRMLEAVQRWFQELHNSYIQILFACGAPCLLLFAAFLVLLAIRCCKTYFSRDAACGETGYLPAILAAVLLIAFMETFLVLYQEIYFANIWFFLIAGCLFSGAAVGEGGVNS